MSQALDHLRLAAIAEGSGASPADIAADFRRTSVADADALLAASRSGDFAEVEQLAHRIRGACMMLGAHGLADACSLVATAGRSGDAAQLACALVKFEHMLAASIATIDRLGAHSNPADLSPELPVARADLVCDGLSFIVVEDHEFQRRVIVTLLRQLGARDVLDFADAAAALAALRERPDRADVMVLDLALPGINGMELMETLGAAKLQLSIIMNSALGADLLRWPLHTARSYGLTVLGAISKPLTEAKLAPMIAVHRARPPAAIRRAGR